MKLRPLQNEFLQKVPRVVALLFFIPSCCLLTSASGGVVTVWSNVDPDGNGHAVEYDDEKDVYYLVEYWYDNFVSAEIIEEVEPLGNPSPDGQSTGLGPDEDALDLISEKLKKIGGSPLQETNPLKTPIGRGLVESGKIPGAEIDPWDVGSMMTEDFGGGGAGGGFDPGVPLGEQIGKKKQKGRGNSDDGDGDGDDKNETFHGVSNVAPEIVDPPPEPLGKSFLLLAPGTAGMNVGGFQPSAQGMDPQPIPWASFGGRIGVPVRTNSVATHGLR